MSAGQRWACARCGSVIQSMHRHHMCFCDCGATAVDGGDSYTKFLFRDYVGLPDLIEEDDNVEWTEWVSGYGRWWSVWHKEDEEFILLQCDADDMCRQFLADMAYPDHLDVRPVSDVAATWAVWE